MLMCATALGMVAGCGWPETRMEPAADYGAADRTTVSAAPSFTAGPDAVRTDSPDGSTTFVCADGSHMPASKVPKGKTPPC
jgi:uncharacterized lipoprotein